MLYPRQIILDLAAHVFSPRDNDNYEAWSSVFMLQQGHAREQQIRELLGQQLGNVDMRIWNIGIWFSRN